MTARAALFRWFPSLVGRVPWVPILEKTTPVQRLSDLERRVGADSLWIKRDDLSAVPFGGNKPRKLEFLLGEARSRDARSLVTFGGIGSNHALATAIYGRQFDFRVTTVLVPQPVDPHVHAVLQAIEATGARLIRVSGNHTAVVGGAQAWVAALARDRRPPALIPPGGSSPTGALGYVSAALELAEQIVAGEAPPPDAIFVAGGSNGTAAGLLAGLRLVGLPSRLVVVRVSDRLRVDEVAILRLAKATMALLRRLGVAKAEADDDLADRLEVWKDYLGQGYGQATPAGDRAVEVVGMVCGITLDRVYTGKTFAAVLDAVRRPAWRDRTILFWHTANSRALPFEQPANRRVTSGKVTREALAPPKLTPG